MADRIVINAKTQRPSVCNAAEKLLVHERIAATYIPRITSKLADLGVELRADEATRKLVPDLPIALATEDDWCEEYLRLCIAIRIVCSVDEAITLINRYSTKNSEAIVTENEANARRFLRAVIRQRSTRMRPRASPTAESLVLVRRWESARRNFTAEALCPAELTSSKYEVFGTGQIRE